MILSVVYFPVLPPKCERLNTELFNWDIIFLQYDLVSTIGESVALGAAGIIMWGDAVYASNKVSAQALIMMKELFF